MDGSFWPNHFLIEFGNEYEDGFSTLINTLVNYADGYMLVIEGADRYNLVVEDYRDLNCWIVKEKNEQTDETTELYSILRISNEKSGTTDLENHIPLIVRDKTERRGRRTARRRCCFRRKICYQGKFGQIF